MAKMAVQMVNRAALIHLKRNISGAQKILDYTLLKSGHLPKGNCKLNPKSI
jgi:hypothetical protein